jgi:2-dehydro-3-deoxyphosphogluconate aldolase / (4S)-4-hydroxy-2-oxoglutarate aldolase
VEVTLNSERSLASISTLRERFSSHELDIGAGTVLDRRSAQAAVEHGAQFLVTPHTDPELIGWAAERNMPCLAGAFTATEVLAGWRAGAAAVKLFPAELIGPRGLRALRGPLDDVALIPTGGVTADNAAHYIAAGASAIAVGSWLTGDAELAGVAERAATLRDRISPRRESRDR